ncbi:MAG: DNA/RNA nuclease SfsA [Thermoplasmata archaeon]|nr:DNA/RNA nuclease SfsA [Thermoplasmata archaeon]
MTGTFITRPNRFIANVRIKGKEGEPESVIRCHVKNTGRYHKLPYIVEAVRLFLPEEQLYLFRIIWIYPINLEWYP